MSQRRESTKLVGSPLHPRPAPAGAEQVLHEGGSACSSPLTIYHKVHDPNASKEN